MSDSSSSGPIGRITTPPISRSSEGKVPEKPKEKNKKPAMVSKEEKKGDASKRAAYAQSKNTSQTKPSRALPQFQEDHSSSRHTSSTATTADSRSSSSSSSESDEEGMIPSSEPTFRSASSTKSATSTSSTSVANPEWARFHQQALKDGGGFVITGDMNIDTVSSWLASSPEGVTAFGIVHTKLADADFVKLCAVLKDNKTLTLIEFFSTDLNVEAFAKVLEFNRAIKKVVIEHIKIDKEGAMALAAALKVNNAINELILNNCSLGDEGAKALAEVFKINEAITDIQLMDNVIGDEGVMALAKALEGNNTIQGLDLNGNKLGRDGAQALLKAMNVNTSINFLITTPYLAYVQVDVEKNKQLLIKKKEAKEALELINVELEKPNTDSASNTENPLFYPREVMDMIVDHMALAGMKDEIINLGNSIKPKT